MPIRFLLFQFAALSCVFLVLPIGLIAQGDRKPAAPPRLGPRSFFPKEYTREGFLDVDALQDTTIWDALERSVLLGPLRMKFRQEFGYRIEDILRVRFTGRHIGEAENSAGGERDVNVIVIEGKVCLPPVRKPEPFAVYQKEKKTVAGHDVVISAPIEASGFSAAPEYYVMPRPDCLVVGDAEMIRSVLEGKRRGGVIESRLMALTAMRHPLAYLAMGFPPPSDPRYHKDIPLDPSWLDEDDPLQHLLVRMTYSEKTEDIKITATLRFKTGKTGPKLLEESAKAAVAALKTQKLYALINSYFQKLAWQRDDVDLRVSVAVKPGDMSGLFGASGLLTFFLVSWSDGGMAPAPVVPVMLAPVMLAPAAKAQTVEAKIADPQKAKAEKADEKKTDKKKKPAKRGGEATAKT